jgi:hypothetical protein
MERSADDVITAMFENREAAERAGAALVAAGIGTDAVHVVDAPHVAAHEAEARSHGIWHRVRAAFIEHHHAHVYAEALERGRSMVFVRSGDPATQERAMQVLEQHHPIDVAQRVRQWAETGWAGVHRSQPPTSQPATTMPPPLLFQDRPDPDHIPSTGLINENDGAPPIGAPLVNPMGIEIPGIQRTGSARVLRYQIEG